MTNKFVWVFKGAGNSVFPSAIFTTKSEAENWIKENVLSGVLTKYPLDISLYDWSIKNEYFRPKNDFQKNAKTIGSFNSAYLEDYHYIDGVN